MQIYFDVSKGVLLKAGVAVLNLDFNLELPYSQDITITHPERICCYEETKMEIDCTRGRNGRKGLIKRWGPGDDITTVVTKSDKCASAVCGCLGDGRVLTVFQ